MSASRNAIDDLDFDILKLLQSDGRMSYTEISKSLGVSVGTARYRISKLLEEETLRVIGRVDPYQIGFRSPATVYVAVAPAASIDEVATEIAEFPEVSYLAMITGDFDLEVDVMCRDQDHLTDLVAERLRKIPGVSETKTNIILRVYKMAQADLTLVDPRFEEDNPGTMPSGDPPSARRI
jgi:Lrp/AsnC family transcriptional regulator for asnA, asnC and gidA